LVAKTGKSIPSAKLEQEAETSLELEEKNPLASVGQEAITEKAPSLTTLEKGTETRPIVNYMLERWELVDKSRGGLAIIRSNRPQHQVRVGDLVAVTHGGGDGGKPTDWTLGVIRWLMVRQGKVYKTGIQKLSQDARLGAIRASGGSELERCYQRAFILSDAETSELDSVIVSQGLYKQNRQMELYLEGDRFEVKADVLLEASLSFEHFRLRK